jgi:hypothetical protein
MKTAFNPIFVLFSSILLFSSCGKYDEGPNFSLRTKTERFCGSWELSSLKVNGVESMDYTLSDYFECISGDIIPATYSSTISQFDWTIRKNGDWNTIMKSTQTELDYVNSYDNCQALYNTYTSTESDNGTWEFDSKKENVIFTYSDNSKETWHIIELKEKEVKLELQDGTDHILFTLSKK